jgi:uncharacterized protein YodC (DUF2158 family)
MVSTSGSSGIGQASQETGLAKTAWFDQISSKPTFFHRESLFTGNRILQVRLTRVGRGLKILVVCFPSNQVLHRWLVPRR